MSEAARKITNGALRILYLEDQRNDVELVRGWLEDEGIHCEISHVQTGPELRAALRKGCVDLILSDYHLPAFDGLKALALAREQAPDVPFILFSGTIGEEVAVESLKLGANDYVLKQRPKRLISAIHQALKAARERAKHRLAETKLREQAALLDKAQDAIMVRDLQDCLVYWNKSAERVYGWTSAEAIGKNADQLLFKDASAKIVEAKQEVLERGEWSGELHQVNKDGKPIVVESRRTLVRDSAGQPRSILDINTDITEKKKLEAQFLRAQRLETIGALAGGIAHDLNNALVPVLVGVQLLREDLSLEDRNRLLDTMRGSAERGSEMVKQIVAFARGVSGEPAVLDLKHLVTEIDKLAKQTFPRSIRVQTRIAKDLCPVTGNATQLHQVLLNLCVNARDAMPQGGDLHIEADNIVLDRKTTSWKPEPVSGPHVVLTVSDTGCGMAPEVLNHVFEPFFTTKEIGKGTGLGLSTVQGIVKSHGGFVDVVSEAGKGTMFKICLPSATAGRTRDASDGNGGTAFRA